MFPDSHEVSLAHMNLQICTLLNVNVSSKNGFDYIERQFFTATF